MAVCMYCNLKKPEAEMTLEHAIPKFLNGSISPERFKVKAACGRCNNNLGIYVDASFEKSYVVSLALAEAAQYAAKSGAKVIPPLVCGGQLDIELDSLGEGEVCEWWVGSQGEHVFLVRPKADDLFWYMGGRPTDLKKASANGRAYYFCNERADHIKSFEQFKESFKRRKVRKYLCAEVAGADVRDFGFLIPDDKEKIVIEDLWRIIFGGNAVPGRIPYASDFDIRFICKLAIGVAYCEFGESYLQSKTASELNEGLWFMGGGEPPKLHGLRPLNNPMDDSVHAAATCEQGAVSILLWSVGDDVILCLNVNQKYVWTIVVARKGEIDIGLFEKFLDGHVVQLGMDGTVLDMGLPEYLLLRVKKEGQKGLR